MEAIIFSAIQDIPMMALVALGFFISLRLMRFPDLSVDASYMFGMSAVGWVVGNEHANELVAFPLAMFFGAMVGTLTGSLHTSKLFGLSKLLSGLLVSFAAYSVCFRLLGSQTPLNLFPFKDHMFFYSLIGNRDMQAVFSMLIVAALYLLTVRLMNTSFGYGVRAVGHRRDVIQAVGVRPNIFVIGGLAFSNMLVASGGWLTASNTTNVALENFGMVVHALAAVLIGEFSMFVFLWLIGKRGAEPVKVNYQMYLTIATPILGAVIYAFIKAFVIKILSGQLKIALTTDFQLVLSLIILGTVAIGRSATGYKGYENDDAF